MGEDDRNKVNKTDDSDLDLLIEFDDGTIDDVAGCGNWHLEEMHDGYFSLVVESEDLDEPAHFDIYAENGKVRVSRSG